MKKGVFAVMLAGAILAGGCVGGGKGISAEDKERLAPYILDAVPADTPHKVDINFENKVHVVGYKFEPEQAKPGQEVKLTYYWRCDDTVEDGWQLFTHVQVDGADKPENLDWSGPIREEKNKKQLLGPDRWEKGKVYVDEQKYTLPAAPTGPEATVYVGIWKGDARLRVISGPNDGDNRAIIGKFKTGVAPKAEEPKKTMNDVPQMTVMKLAANDKITIDGKADEKAWGGAASTGPFVDVGTGRPAATFPVKGSVKLLWDDQNLYAFFDITDPDLTGYFTDPKSQPQDWTATGLPKLWTKHTVEMMVDPDGDGDNINYYELQINVQNKMFHSQFDTYNAPKGGENGPFGHEDWDPGLKSAVVAKGTIDKHDDKDDGYTVEVAIPWKAYQKGAKTLPPKHGDTWRMNFYGMMDNGGVSWSPILGQGNFHRASRFGRVTFAVPGQSLGDGGVEGGAGDAGPVTMGLVDGGANPLDALFGDGGSRRPRVHLPRGATPMPGTAPSAP